MIGDFVGIVLVGVGINWDIIDDYSGKVVVVVPVVVFILLLNVVLYSLFLMLQMMMD